MNLNVEQKNMRFFVFPEFKNMHLLEKVRNAFPDMDVPKYSTPLEIPLKGADDGEDGEDGDDGDDGEDGDDGDDGDDGENEKKEKKDVRLTNAKLFFRPKDKSKVDNVLDTLYEIGFDVVKQRPYQDFKDKKSRKTFRVYMDDRVILSG